MIYYQQNETTWSLTHLSINHLIIVRLISINFNKIDFMKNMLFSLHIINIMTGIKNDKQLNCYQHLHKQQYYMIFYKLITIYRRFKKYFRIDDV